MSNANVIKVRSNAHSDETYTASEAFLPGHLVERHVSSGVQLRKQSTVLLDAQKVWALNRDERGEGPQDAVLYVIGNQVKTMSFQSGDRVRVFIQSGETVTGIEALEAAGDGTLQVFTTGVILAWSRETSGGALAADTLLEIEVA